MTSHGGAWVVQTRDASRGITGQVDVFDHDYAGDYHVPRAVLDRVVTSHGGAWVVQTRDASRGITGQVDVFDSLDVVLRHNRAGAFQLTVPADHAQRDLFTPGAGVIIWSPDVAAPIMSGQVRGLAESVTTDTATVTVTGVDDTARLAGRVVYPDPARTADDQTTDTNWVDTGAAGSVIRSMVDTQAGAGALAARQVPGLSVNPDTALGETVAVNARFSPLLDTVAGLADAGEVGFRLIQWDVDDGPVISTAGTGTTDVRLQVYTPVDRSDRVRFTAASGALSGWQHAVTAGTVTRAIVAGQGEGTARFVIELADATAETDWGERQEQFIDARDTNDTTVLTQRGHEQFLTAGAAASLQATPSATGLLVFGRDWWLGDTVTMIVDSVTVTAPVSAVQIKVTGDGEAVVTPTVGPDATLTGPRIYAAVRALNRRIQQLETI